MGYTCKQSITNSLVTFSLKISSQHEYTIPHKYLLSADIDFSKNITHILHNLHTVFMIYAGTICSRSSASFINQIESIYYEECTTHIVFFSTKLQLREVVVCQTLEDAKKIAMKTM